VALRLLGLTEAKLLTEKYWKNLKNIVCGMKKGKGMFAGERGSPLLTLLGIALKLPGVHGVIQGKYHTSEKCHVVLAWCQEQISVRSEQVVFCQSKNFVSKVKLTNGRLAASKRNALNTF